MKLGTIGFVGDRLREGRQARGFTSAALAVPLGVKPASITQYETNIQTPRSDVMRKVEATLQLPLRFFIRPSSREEGVVYWRSLASATQLAQTVAERRLGWVQDITEALREHLTLAPLSIPEFDVPKDPIRITDELIETLAMETRNVWGIGDGPIGNVTRLIEERGIIVAQDDLYATSLDALSKWCPVEHGAYFLTSSGKESACRSRLNLLHELGHLILHRHLDRWHLGNKALHKMIEAQAFHFAGAFALPAASFSSDLYSLSLDAFIALKKRWKFAVSMMLKRCESLGIGNEQTMQRLWISLSSRGWRLHEPLDDEIEQELPMLLADGIKFLLANQLIAKEYLPETCALPAKDIEELAGLERGTIDTSVTERVTKISRNLNVGTDSRKGSSGGGSVLPFTKPSKHI
jgi:Zn-dependent peptidase ImmA (M78 family)/transcriptional regulator with XRE-family HTH domain